MSPAPAFHRIVIAGIVVVIVVIVIIVISTIITIISISVSVSVSISIVIVIVIVLVLVLVLVLVVAAVVVVVVRSRRPAPSRAHELALSPTLAAVGCRPLIRASGSSNDPTTGFRVRRKKARGPRAPPAQCC